MLQARDNSVYLMVRLIVGEGIGCKSIADGFSRLAQRRGPDLAGCGVRASFDGQQVVVSAVRQSLFGKNGPSASRTARHSSSAKRPGVVVAAAVNAAVWGE